MIVLADGVLPFPPTSPLVLIVIALILATCLTGAAIYVYLRWLDYKHEQAQLEALMRADRQAAQRKRVEGLIDDWGWD